MYQIIVAVTQHNGIGYNGSIPWNSRADMRHFRDMTKSTKYFNNAVIMGRKTFESIDTELKDRTSIVITQDPIKYSDIYSSRTKVLFVSNIEEAETAAKHYDNVFIIGGQKIYEAFLHKVSKIHVSHILNDDSLCDTFFPNIPDYFTPIESKPLIHDNKVEAVCVTYVANYKNPDEYQYMNLVNNILRNGTLKTNRTGIPTLSIFGHSMKWSLENGRLPLLTTKKVFTRAIIEELLWFISGSTDSKILESKGINIWKDNTTRQFLDSRGLPYEEGSIGAGYGFQWRHSGADYHGIDNYSGSGVDQVAELIDSIRKDPNSRRHIICSWNPSALSKMALPPCHVLFQVYVENNVIHSSLYQRSADVGLGLPFNIASYAVLTHMIAHCCDTTAGSFTHFTGDTHIYETHIDGLKKQLERMPREAPTFRIITDNKDIFSLKYEDFVIDNYNPHPTISMPMAV